MSPLAGSRENIPHHSFDTTNSGLNVRSKQRAMKIRGKDRRRSHRRSRSVPVERDLQAVEPPAGERRSEHDAGGQCVRGLRVEIRITADEPLGLVGGIVVSPKAFLREALRQAQRHDLCLVRSGALGAACLARIAGRVAERRSTAADRARTRSAPARHAGTNCVGAMRRPVDTEARPLPHPAGRGVLRVSVTHDGLERTDAGPIREQRNRRLDIQVGVVILRLRGRPPALKPRISSRPSGRNSARRHRTGAVAILVVLVEDPERRAQLTGRQFGDVR